MKTMRIEGAGPALNLQEADAPMPAHGPGELLIRVHAAGVTPTELKWYPTTHAKSGELRPHAIPGHEFSGVVEAHGDLVTTFHVGQEVYGMNDWFAEGATAEYCVTQPGWIAPKPARLSHVQAASVPIGALTAWQGLFERAKLQAGERVLVHGGAGAVGSFAVQLARQAGAQVFTTASARHQEFLTELGAEQVVDYRAERFEDLARDMDVVFDTVGGATLLRSWSVLKPEGRLVTIAADGENAVDERTKAAFFIVEPSATQLTEIAHRLDRRELQPFVDAVVPLVRANEAYLERTERRTGRGKVVIAVVADFGRF